MSPTEIAIYAVETKAIIYVLWGLLLIASLSLVAVSITYALLRIKVRSGRRRESQLARHVAVQSVEVKRLEDRVAALADLEATVEGLKAQAQRSKTLRSKSEQRLTDQNGVIDALRTRIDEKEAELRIIRPASPPVFALSLVEAEGGKVIEVEPSSVKGMNK